MGRGIIGKFVGLALLAATFVAASLPLASAGEIVCPPHNPNADLNLCVAADLTTAPLNHPSVGGFEERCIVSNFCVPLPTTEVSSTNVPDVTLCGTYVWAQGQDVYRAECNPLLTPLVNGFSTLELCEDLLCGGILP